MNEAKADLTGTMGAALLRMHSEPTQDEIQRLRARLDRSEKDAQRFLDGVVHDFRSAHRAISISLEILLGSISPQHDHNAAEAVRELQTGVAKMNAILSGVSSYALCASPSTYSFGLVATETAMKQALASLEPEIRDTGAVLVPGVLPSVFGDVRRLTELFRNLIGNALKYRSTAVPRIEIGATRNSVGAVQNSNEWLFSVRDNGVGIDPKYWDGLFVPFHRLHGNEIPGIGLGLSICRKIVEAHGGSIRLESRVGHGAAFLFTLPAEEGGERGSQ
jgi:chemotaxis family two-component system sensor kinase Cph1